VVGHAGHIFDQRIDVRHDKFTRRAVQTDDGIEGGRKQCRSTFHTEALICRAEHPPVRTNGCFHEGSEVLEVRGAIRDRDEETLWVKDTPDLPGCDFDVGHVIQHMSREHEVEGSSDSKRAVRNGTRNVGSSADSWVEVIGHYSNPPRQPADLRKLLTATPVRDHEIPETRPPRQHQRRLRPDELARLVADYLAGVEVIELARRYGMARQTVFDQMRREGVPRRNPRLSAVDIEKAAELYRADDSLATIGEVFGVDPGTVRRALIKLGVPMRDCHGNEQVASS
jgi:hypothetical protein